MVLNNKIKAFKSGSEIRLARLLDNDVKIIIPDLQRDYCWGTTMCQNEPTTSLAANFVRTLVSNYKEKKNLSLGLIYGYEVPAGHLQLCDGQQRITTLYLLLGMLNRKTHTLGDRLISQREWDDDKEPYLQYSIRESSLYFMSDLVSRYFMSDSSANIDVEDIRKQSWYFKDYDNDPSIISMIASMKSIDGELSSLSQEDLFKFGYFLCQEVKFIYYDMQDRKQGEETFVIINTKGESLSVTENLKPIFIDHFGDGDEIKRNTISKDWEEFEDFFWKNRGKNDTADAGMKEFFRWIYALHIIVSTEGISKEALTKDDSEFTKIRKTGEFSFDCGKYDYDFIITCFGIIKNLFSNKDLEFPKETLSPKQGEKPAQNIWFQVLPLILYLYKYPNARNENIKRLWHFLKISVQVTITAKNMEVVLPHILLAVKSMQNEDILSIAVDNWSDMLFTPEVKEKFKLCRQHKENRSIFEKELWNAEEDEKWMYEIMPLIDWAKSDSDFSLEKFCQYRETFANLYNGSYELDTLRRLLLAKGAPDYPCTGKKFVRSSNYLFGSDHKEWREVIDKNTSVFGDIIGSLIGKPINDYVSILENQLNAELSTDLLKVKDDEKKLFVQNPEFLRSMGNRYARIWSESFVLLQGKNATNAAFMRSLDWKFYAEGAIKKNALPIGWSLEDYYWDNSGGCTYFHYNDLQTSILYCIDVEWRPKGYNVSYFCKSDGDTCLVCKTQALNNGMHYDDSIGRYVIQLAIDHTPLQVLNFVIRLMQ